MARNFSLVVTVLFFLFTFVYAQTPLDLPEKEASNILLPTEKPNSEKDEESKKGSDVQENEAKPTEETSEFQTITVPLTVINFRPINRQFPRRPMIPLRHGRPCRHHRFKTWGPRFNGREFSYGNDMILAGGEDVGFDRQMTKRRDGLKYGGPRFHFVKEEIMKPHHHHEEHHHRHHHEEEEEKEHDHHHDDGFVKRIRKFLNHF